MSQEAVALHALGGSTKHPRLRSSMRGKLSSTTILLSLAIGIGSAGAAISCFESLFVRAIPGVRGADQVLVLATEARGSSLWLPVSYPNYRDLRDQSRSFSELAAAQAIQVALADKSSELVRGEMVTANYFAALGVEPLRGRFFSPREDRVHAGDPVVVLSEELWRRRFGSDPGAVGQTLHINGRPYLILGVAGQGFRGANVLSRAELWIPTAMYRQVSPLPDLFEHRGDQTLQVFGRLKQGVSVRGAVTEIQALSTRLVDTFPADNKDLRIVAQPLPVARLDQKGRAILERVSIVLVGMGLLLLLVACGNVASLTLIRTLGRLEEFALRSALGAHRSQLYREILVESLPLALLALPLGFLATRFEIGLLGRFRPPFLPADLLLQTPDIRTLAMLALISLASCFLLWLAPALAIRHLDPARAVRGRAHLHLASHSLAFFRRLIVALEVALSFVAIFFATYSIFHLRELQGVNPGFDASKLLSAAFDLRGLDLTPSSAKQVGERIRESVSSLPGVQTVAYSSDRLLGGAQLMHSVVLPTREDGPSLMGSSSVEPAYFEAVGIPLLSGRHFELADTSTSPPVAIVNRTTAMRLWPGRSAVKEHVFLDEERTPVEVVGVVHDSMLTGVDEIPHMFLYLPLAQRPSAHLALHLRASGDPKELLEPLGRRIRVVAAGLPLEAETVSNTLARALWWPRAIANLLTLLSGLTVFIAGTGLYSLASYSSSRRKPEIGLRLALGAPRKAIFGLVVRDSLKVLGWGLVLGGIASVALARWETGLTWTSPLLLANLVGSALLLLVISLLAELAPALQAMMTEPSTVLKA